MKQFILFSFLIMLSLIEVFGQHNPLLNGPESYLSIYDMNDFEQEEFQPKSENTAALLSLAVPLATIGTGALLVKNDQNFLGGLLLGGGIVIAPSAGNMYAKNMESVVLGVQTRLVGAGMIAVGTYWAFTNAMGAALGGNEDKSMEIGGELLAIGGAGLIVYSTVYDIFNSRRNVQSYNKNKGDVYFSVSPIYYPKFKSVGIGISASY